VQKVKKHEISPPKYQDFFYFVDRFIINLLFYIIYLT